MAEMNGHTAQLNHMWGSRDNLSPITNRKCETSLLSQSQCFTIRPWGILWAFTQLPGDRGGGGGGVEGAHPQPGVVWPTPSRRPPPGVAGRWEGDSSQLWLAVEEVRWNELEQLDPRSMQTCHGQSVLCIIYSTTSHLANWQLGLPCSSDLCLQPGW